MGVWIEGGKNFDMFFAVNSGHDAKKPALTALIQVDFAGLNADACRN